MIQHVFQGLEYGSYISESESEYIITKTIGIGHNECKLWINLL